MLAVLRNNTRVSFNGSYGAVGVQEVAGDVNFNSETNYHDVTWRPTVRALARTGTVEVIALIRNSALTFKAVL